jgi:hypothetical protein
VVGGFYGGKPFLGSVGMIGTNYTDVHVATGEPAGAVQVSLALVAPAPQHASTRLAAGWPRLVGVRPAIGAV